MASGAALAPRVPDFALIIDDLARVPEASLLEREGGPLGKLVVWVLRATRLGFDPALVARWAEELNRAEETGPREALLQLLQYLLGTEEGTAVFEALQSAPISAPVREVVMGYLQKWFEEGRAEALLTQLRLRLDGVLD